MSEAVDLRPLLPAAIVSLAGLMLLLAQAFAPKGTRPPSLLFSLVGLGGGLVATLLLAPERRQMAVTGNALAADGLAVFAGVVILLSAVGACLLSSGYLRQFGGERGEHYVLILFATAGMLGLVSCVELVSLFVALEVASVALYALAGSRRERPESQESALKYFITGAFSSAFLLYGIALVYGATGSTSIHGIASELELASSSSRILALAGVGLMLVGFGFKIAAVPFHLWAPDVYEGAPTSVTAFMAAAVKVAGFGALFRVFGDALLPLAEDWRPAVAVLAIVTMIVGNLGALAQTGLKRMLAYSSIAHAGYVLIAFVAPAPRAGQAMLFYLAGYAIVSIGSFGAVVALSRNGSEPISITDLSGLAGRRPLVAAGLTVFLLSLTGIPLTGGFVGKLYLFNAAVSAGWTVLAVVGVLMSVVSAYYYLRVVVAMYMRVPIDGQEAWGETPSAAGAALAFCVVVTLVLGIVPGAVLTLARQAAERLF